jgi:hypothetical protein
MYVINGGRLLLFTEAGTFDRLLKLIYTETGIVHLKKYKPIERPRRPVTIVYIRTFNLRVFIPHPFLTRHTTAASLSLSAHSQLALSLSLFLSLGEQ